jgi:hypothetical protein
MKSTLFRLSIFVAAATIVVATADQTGLPLKPGLWELGTAPQGTMISRGKWLSACEPGQKPELFK